MMTPPDSDDKVIKMEHNTSVLQFAQASDAFLILEARIDTEGFTTEIVKQLGKIVNSYVDTENPAVTDDWAFAVTKLSYKELFEPNVKSTREQGFIDAVYNLNVAADAGVQSAYGVLAMLDLIGIPEPEEMEDSNVHLLSRQEKLTRANEKLLSLYGIQDVMATLAIAYGTLSGRISMPMETYDKDAFTDMDAVCENTVSMYHMCAKKNVDTIADEGDERFVKVVRLSNELLDSTGSVFFDEFFAEAVDPLLDENDALYRLEYYRSIAENPMDEQYAQAMHGLGEMYYFGDRAAHVAVDRELAARYFRQAADAGDALAQANYGILLADGIGVNRDVSQALVYFNRAAQQNQAFAFYCLGKMYFTGTGVPQNVTRALECFNEAIALGYAETHSFLGSVYLNGDEGVPVDHEAAFFHFQAAVDGTDGPSSQALLDLGVVHFRGINTPRSCPTALSLFRSVALHPNLLSRLPFSLVKGYECYKKGDYLRAYLNYRLVAELGDEVAQCNAAFLLEHHGDSILKWKWLGLTNSVEDSSKLALREAFTLYSRAAALNDSEAVRKTGACYHEPWAGVCPSNHTRALERYRFAAELGDLEAGFNCGVMFLTGDGVPQDFVAARNCYAKCSEAVFPANVPCALALVGLDILEAIGAVVVKMLEFVL
ncbi:unnamed protein product [Peronospora belbahrii]|uniref:Uncharacterized protein n=1 Tax=Peronospora belbahrii TaxID=622444 RepID=A0AAU9L7W1_9STRA|nr:unnamed protein product [Peronospora belbahrii]